VANVGVNNQHPSLSINTCINPRLTTISILDGWVELRTITQVDTQCSWRPSWQCLHCYLILRHIAFICLTTRHFKSVSLLNC